jgi:hypothetical protein
MHCNIFILTLIGQNYINGEVVSLNNVNLNEFFLLSLRCVCALNECDCEGSDETELKGQGEEMKVNVRKESSLRSDVTGVPLELDVWFPRLNLAFEFQVCV